MFPALFITRQVLYTSKMEATDCSRLFYLWPLACGSVSKVVVEDLTVIKDNGFRKVLLGKNLCRTGIIGAFQFARTGSDKDHGYRVKARVALGVGIGVELFCKHYDERCFLLRLSKGRMFYRFSYVDKPSRQGPPMGFILSFNKNDPALITDDDVHCHEGGFDHLQIIQPCGNDSKGNMELRWNGSGLRTPGCGGCLIWQSPQIRQKSQQPLRSYSSASLCLKRSGWWNRAFSDF